MLSSPFRTHRLSPEERKLRFRQSRMLSNERMDELVQGLSDGRIASRPISYYRLGSAFYLSEELPESKTTNT